MPVWGWIVIAASLFVAAIAVSYAMQTSETQTSGSNAPIVVLSTPSPSPSPSLSATPAAQIGQQATNGGATVTVKSVRTAATVSLNKSNYRPGSGYEKYTDVPAGGAAKYVIVETSVLNTGKASMDLTCSYAIAAKLVDDKGRQFDPIEDLYTIKGNPECNKQLQPGFASDMTWVYRVPSDASIVEWQFEDTADWAALGGGDNPTQVRITS